MNPVINYELSERTIAALFNENSGNFYHRINTIRARCLDALIASVLGDEEKEYEIDKAKTT